MLWARCHHSGRCTLKQSQPSCLFWGPRKTLKWLPFLGRDGKSSTQCLNRSQGRIETNSARQHSPRLTLPAGTKDAKHKQPALRARKTRPRLHGRSPPPAARRPNLAWPRQRARARSLSRTHVHASTTAARVTSVKTKAALLFWNKAPETPLLEGTATTGWCEKR